MLADVPVIYGIITADTVEQAADRAGIKSGNKGFDAAMTAIEMTALYEFVEDMEEPMDADDAIEESTE